MPASTQAQEKFLPTNHPDDRRKGGIGAVKGLPFKAWAKSDGHVGPLAKMFTKGGSK